jgi:hypothetical protein
MSAAHFIYIPAILMIGIVVGWILGSRAAADAYAADLRRREERLKKTGPEKRGQTPFSLPGNENGV